ncbi:hypothetical protein JXO59_07470 [candidate division KSB1 bacterium]|nr:hypothetical protein [candidate division KSB1 bacterium]
MKKKWIILALLIVVWTLTGCGLQSQSSSSTPSTENDTYIPQSSSGGSLDDLMQWPAYLPDDIPVLSDNIRLVMGSANSKVRIFYESLSEKQIEQYVDLCEDNGFDIEYLVYTQEGFTDNSGKKIKAGDFDAVEMSRGDIRMRLEYGEDTTTLDIYMPGESPKAPDADDALKWPENLGAYIPQPDGCEVRNIANLSYGGYQIACEYKDGDLRLDEYIQVLESLSFQEIDRLVNDNDEIVYLTFGKESISFKLMPHALSSTLTIQSQPENP